ncbi:LysR family transcriptional regulator [Pseudoalteromonas spongiae]|uniref:LysR family transcriptional regulator n=1 Tax=Pseudoalteromonas spongiae TaxID=298657 RepID=UPI00110B58F2|nr:LysR family transcriptional regulator [Pseudoalteromonas spongiae]TMO82832.1 LysR family transcriptional regulator [Pseudoalteromonas spongiae]
MRLRHIEVFHAIYTTGSITNAAQFLHVSQPSVSKVLAHAEQQLGFALFERVKGRLIPTSQAEALFSEVDKVYKQIRGVRNTAENIKKSSSGHINIGFTPALGFDLIPLVISEFKKRYPGVHINLQTLHNEDVQQALMEHKLDLAIMFSPPPIANISAIPLCKSEMVMVAPKPILPSQQTDIETSELAKHELIGIWDSGPLGDLLWNRLSENEVSVSSSIQVQTYFIASRLVAQNIGVCVVDEFTARGNLTNDTDYAGFKPKLEFDVQALHLSDKPLSVNCRAFIDILMKQV